MDLKEIEISTQRLYDGKVVNLELSKVMLPNGKNALREAVRHSGGAAVLYVKDGEVLLERQFRFPYGKVIWEIPAGKLNKGENPFDAARRELEEETGYLAENFVKLAEIYPSPGYTDEIIHIFYTLKACFVKENPDEDEFINTEFVKIENCVEMIENGEICDAKTIVAIYKYLHDRDLKR